MVMTLLSTVDADGSRDSDGREVPAAAVPAPTGSVDDIAGVDDGDGDGAPLNETPFPTGPLPNETPLPGDDVDGATGANATLGPGLGLLGECGTSGSSSDGFVVAYDVGRDSGSRRRRLRKYTRTVRTRSVNMTSHSTSTAANSVITITMLVTDVLSRSQHPSW